MKTRSDGRVGFTLIELLVVLAIIGVLAALLLPALGRAKQAGQSTQCLSNVRQLQMAFHLYTEDYNGWFPYNNALYVAIADTYVHTLPDWVRGYMDYKSENGYNTNGAALLAEGTVGAYLQNATVFRCPADKSYVESPFGKFNRVRSVRVCYESFYNLLVNKFMRLKLQGVGFVADELDFQRQAGRHEFRSSGHRHGGSA